MPLFPRPSTRALWRESRKIQHYPLIEWIHGYIYSRWPYFYIGVGTGNHPLTKYIAPVASKVIEVFARFEKHDQDAPKSLSQGEMFANTYHGKVVPLKAAKQFVQIHEPIAAALPESVIPYDRAREIILQNPDHIIALDCPCRVVRPNPCLPLDVCLIIGEPFASFVSEHQPTHTRWITRDEAEAIIKAEDERGHVHHAFFKEAMLGRFYAICNCCDCCCGAMQAQKNGVPMLAASGYTAEVEEELCLACGECVAVCQFHAIQVQDVAQIDTAACMGCGVCVNHCPNEALSLRLDATKGIPLEVFAL